MKLFNDYTLSFVLLLIGLNANSQWEKIGDSEYSADAHIYIKNSSIFIRGYNGIFCSTNQGKLWNKIADFSTALAIGDSFIYNLNDSYVSDDLAIYYSLFDSINWIKQVPRTPIFPHNFMAFHDILFVTNNDGEVFKSIDHGKNWQNSSNGLYDDYALFCGPSIDINELTTDGKDLYLGTSCAGIFKSLDTAKTWNPINNGLPFDEHFVVYEISFSKTKIFIATSKGLFYSDNKGASWNLIQNLDLDLMYVPLLDAKDSIVVISSSFSNVNISYNEGQTWFNLKNKLLDTTFANPDVALSNQGDIYISGAGIDRINIMDTSITYLCSYGLNKSNTIKLLKQNNNIYASTKSGGIYYSRNKGANWNVSSNDLVGKCVNDMICYKNELYACTNDGLYNSTDSSISWNKIYQIINAKSLLIKDDYIFIGTDASVIKLNIVNNQLDSIFIPSNQEIINLIYLIKNNLFIGTSNGLFFSDVNDKVWNKVNSTSNLEINAILDYNNSIFIGTNSTVFILDSDFQNISELGNNLPSTKINSLSVNDTIIITGTNEGIFDYFNGNWHLDLYVRDINSYALLVSDSILFAGTNDGIYIRPKNYIPTSIESNKLVINTYVFPNPCDNKIILRSAKLLPNNLSINIYDIQGIKVLSKRFYQSDFALEIDISFLQKGIYIIQLDSDNANIYSCKILKK
jgi:ligand-binding sensor domain-containing protein